MNDMTDRDTEKDHSSASSDSNRPPLCRMRSEDTAPTRPNRRKTPTPIKEGEAEDFVLADEDEMSSLNEFSTLSDEEDYSRRVDAHDSSPKRPLRRSTVQQVPFHYRPSILLLGDSLTQYAFGMDGEVGWGSLLSTEYQRRADVFNRGFSGYNTKNIIDILPRILGRMDSKVIFVTVWLGANDAALPGEAQHVPMEEYCENIKTIIKKIRWALTLPDSNVPILLLTPPPVDEAERAKFTKTGESDRTNELARQYGEKVKEAAAKDVDAYVAVIDAWEVLEGETDYRGKYLADGLHLNAAGNTKIFYAITDTLARVWPHLMPMVDGDGRYGKIGIPMEEKLWHEL